MLWTRGLLRKGYGICHGVAGNAYGFLTAYQLTGDQKYIYQAIKVVTYSITEIFTHASTMLTGRYLSVCLLLSEWETLTTVHLLGPFHGAIAVPSVTCCRCRRGHRCAGGARQYW